MTAPIELKEYEPLDPRLVTKTSLRKPRETIALALILWFSDGRPGAIEYGRESGASKDGGIINSTIVDKVASYATDHNIELDRSDIKTYLIGNPLLESQMESLNSAFELVWRLGSFAFTDEKLTRTAERTGNMRFRKRIRFSSNVDLINILFESARDEFAAVLLNWLTGGHVKSDQNIESRFIRALEIFSEPARYKTSKDTGTVFTIKGVYDAILNDNESVDVVDRGEEAQGTTRILKTAIAAGLFPPLTINGNSVDIKEVDRATVKSYVERMQVSAEISYVKTEYTEKNATKKSAAVASIGEPRNYIFFGAPGTGKSHELDRLAVGTNNAPGLFGKDHVTRVTFYPDYMYSQFVGCFKPYSDPDANEEITYKFVPGPFLETYLKAITHPFDNYALLIEEINRANSAAVFGDVFQLLDRDKNGNSVYPVATSKEMADCIRKYFDKLSPDEKDAIERYYDDIGYEEARRMLAENLQLPSNMFIWATMNSADQGVFPMDTAFKRRWDFRYMNINEGKDADIDGTPLSEIEVPCGEYMVKWNDLRMAINNFLINEVHVNEDKLLGPFFVAPSSLTPENFERVFKDKVLLYLYEDAGKTKRTKLFADGLTTYSQICSAFEEKGVKIFGNGFVAPTFLHNGEIDAADSDIAQE